MRFRRAALLERTGPSPSRAMLSGFSSTLSSQMARAVSSRSCNWVRLRSARCQSSLSSRSWLHLGDRSRLLRRLVPAGARSGEMMWAPNSLSSNPERLWRRRTMDTNARKKVRTRRRSNRASSHPPNGPMNNSNRSATCCPCRRPTPCCNIRKPPSVFWSLDTPTPPEGSFVFQPFPEPISSFPKIRDDSCVVCACRGARHRGPRTFDTRPIACRRGTAERRRRSRPAHPRRPAFRGFPAFPAQQGRRDRRRPCGWAGQ